MIPVLESALRVLKRLFPDDPSTPSITLSLTEASPQRVWYASMLRYHEAYGGDREVLASAHDATFRGALMKIARELLSVAAVDAAVCNTYDKGKLAQAARQLRDEVGGQISLATLPTDSKPIEFLADAAEDEGYPWRSLLMRIADAGISTNLAFVDLRGQNVHVLVNSLDPQHPELTFRVDNQQHIYCCYSGWYTLQTVSPGPGLMRVPHDEPQAAADWLGQLPCFGQEFCPKQGSDHRTGSAAAPVLLNHLAPCASFISLPWSNQGETANVGQPKLAARRFASFLTARKSGLGVQACRPSACAAVRHAPPRIRLYCRFTPRVQLRSARNSVGLRQGAATPPLQG